MSLLLLTLAVALLLVACAAGLWWWAASRQHKQTHSQHLQQHLDESADPAAVHDATLAMSEKKPPEHPLDALMLRAGLHPGWRLPVLALLGLAIIFLLATVRMHSMLGGIIVGIICAALAAFWIGMRIQRQRGKLIGALPDFLENMVRLTSVGESLPMAFQNATEHTPMPLRAVLDDTMRHMRAGIDLEDALHQSSHMYDLKELDMLESVLRMSDKYGGRTDLILQRMSDFMHDLEQAQQELRSITSETRLSSWVLGLLPLLAAGAMMLLNPGFFKPMFTHSLGHTFLLIALCLEALGAFLLYRLAKSL